MKALITECASFADTTLKSLTHNLKRLFHKVTSPLPRRLPSTTEEFERLRDTLSKYYGLDKDDPNVWITVSGQITSTPATSVRKSYKDIANAAKRLNINLIAHTYKTVAIATLNAKLEEKMKQTVEAMKSEPKEEPDVQVGSPDLQ